MIPNPNYKYPDCWAAYPAFAKKKKAEELYSLYGPMAMGMCQEDFKIASLIAYKVAVDYFKNAKHDHPWPEQLWKCNKFYLPVSYAGGNMSFGRVFIINHCAFSSPDSIIGFRNSENPDPQEDFKVLKGLRFIGTLRNWVLFKLDRILTDDMTGMLYSSLEKNFTIEFAHFPHDAERRIVYRWVDC